MSIFSQQPVPLIQRAVLIREFGQPEVMHYQEDVAVPKLSTDEVLVKVAYAGINPIDYKTRQGKGWGADRIRKNKFEQNESAILGFDMAGIVVKSHSDQFNIGDRVAALVFEGGCYAQYVAVAANLLAKIPPSVTFEQAGAVPCIGQTAIQFLAFADIKQGEHVVMNAPAGGVGHLLIQLLLNRIAKDDIKVTVICSAEKYHKLTTLIDTSLLAGWIDYTEAEKFPHLQADVLLDLVGDDAGVKALEVLKIGARVHVLPTIWVDKLKAAGQDKNLHVDGYVAKPSAADMSHVLHGLATGELTLHIQQTFPLSEVAAAHHTLQKGDTFGKIGLDTTQ